MGNPQPSTSYHLRYAVHRLDVGWLGPSSVFFVLQKKRGREEGLSLRYSQALLERVQVDSFMECLAKHSLSCFARGGDEKTK